MIGLFIIGYCSFTKAATGASQNVAQFRELCYFGRSTVTQLSELCHTFRSFKLLKRHFEMHPAATYTISTSIPIELTNQFIQKDTIPTSLTIIPTKKIKQQKKSWLPKIRLRFFVLLFKNKLKEKNKKQLKPKNKMVDNGKKKGNRNDSLTK